MLPQVAHDCAWPIEILLFLSRTHQPTWLRDLGATGCHIRTLIYYTSSLKSGDANMEEDNFGRLILGCIEAEFREYLHIFSACLTVLICRRYAHFCIVPNSNVSQDWPSFRQNVGNRWSTVAHIDWISAKCWRNVGWCFVKIRINLTIS